MAIGTYIKKIDKYLAKDNVQPLIIDLQNRSDLSDIVTHYHVGDNVFIATSNYCNTDEYPHIDTLLDVLARENKKFFVTGLSSFLKLEGENELRETLKSILGMTISGHVVVLTYQCKHYLQFQDPRLKGRVNIVDAEPDIIPEIVFTSSGLAPVHGSSAIKGLHNFAEGLEKHACDKMYVETAKQKETFPFSLYTISNLSKAYDVLLERDRTTYELHENSVPYTSWDYTLSKFGRSSSWMEVIDSEFGSHTTLDLVIPSFQSFDEERKGLYFNGLKLFGAKNNWCLNDAAQKASSVSELIRQIYRSLLDKDYRMSDYEKYYLQRKALLNQLGNPGDEVIDFCRIVRGKGKDAVYYLTDNTQNEKELIFELLDAYADQYTREDIVNALKIVYPALYDYLTPYRFKNDLLDQYFQDYKYQKVINKVLPEFETIVTEQAEKREYNLILAPRSSVIESIDREGAQLYFIDAMGVEYLSYIMALCKEFKLLANVTVCSCELPSITSKNKEFLSLFENSPYQTVNFKDIDDIKHHGKDNYDYQQTKLPIHLSKELELIRELLMKIKDRLSSGKIHKAILVSDHGASRLAVIHETENIWQMNSTGEHSGRCCLKTDVDMQPECATDAGEFWALANYDRFKGGRKANVEVHGGATLEEVTVPIIELTYLNSSVEVHLLPGDADSVILDHAPEIFVSFRKKAALKIFATSKLQNVSVRIDGKYYDANAIDSNFYYVEMPDIKKAKTYYVDVLTCGNTIAEKLPLIVKKEGTSEKNLL